MITRQREQDVEQVEDLVKALALSRDPPGSGLNLRVRVGGEGAFELGRHRRARAAGDLEERLSVLGRRERAVERGL